MRTKHVVKIYGDELFSVVLTEGELYALTADQLREAVTAYSCQFVVRRADGTFTMIDYSGCDGEHFDAHIVNRLDGSFEVVEIVTFPRGPRKFAS